MTDRVALLQRLDAAARVLRRAGLAPATRVGRELARRVLRGGLRIRWDDFLVCGGIEHRGYLASLRAGRREPGTLARFREMVPPGGLVVDVGAYLGVYTLVAARLVGPTDRVVACEADPRTLPWLHRNVERNGFQDRVVILEAAVSDRSGRAAFFLNDGDASASSLAVRRPRARRIEVRTVALDEALADLLPVDVMKIDVEGAEPRVLRGAARTLARSPRATLILEMNPRALHASGSSPEDLLEILASQGFIPTAIDEASGELCNLPDSWAGVKYVNLLAGRASPEQPNPQASIGGAGSW